MSKQVNELGLATQGVQYFDGTSVYSGVTGSTGQVLQANTSAAPTYSTATYPSTTTINQILYSSASNTVSGLSTSNNGVLITGTTGVPSLLAAGTTGQVLVATTGSPPSWASLSGFGVTSITGTANRVSANGSFTVAQNGAVTLSLPQDIATTSAVAFATLTLNGAARINLGVSGTQVATDNVLQTGILSATTFSPATSTTFAGSMQSQSTFSPPGGVTITNAVGVIVSAFTSGGAGTVTNSYGLYVQDPGIGNSYSAYFASTVGIGTATPSASALLAMSSTSKGFLPPSMTTTQKNAIVSPASGLTVYDNVLLDLQFYNGTSWVGTTGSGVTSITGTANQVIASASTGAVTLSTPQDIATTSSVVFGSATLNKTGTGPQIAATFNNTDTGGTTSESRIVFAEGGNWYQGLAGKFNGASPYLGISVNTTSNTWNGIASFWNNGGLSLGASYYTTLPPTNGSIIQGNVAIGTSTPAASAVLTLSSTSQGFLPPSMTTTQKNAISSPAAGLTVYDNVLLDLQFYNGTSWIGASGSGVTSITGTANQVIASASTGAVTLSLPQSIATSSTVQFAKLGLGGAASNNQLSITGKASVGFGDLAAPSNGLIVSGHVLIGSSNTPSNAVVGITAGTVSEQTGLYLTGTLVFSSTPTFGIRSEYTFTTEGAETHWGIYEHNTYATPAANTVTSTADFTSSPIFTGSGTITNAYGFRSIAFSRTGTAITNAYGAFFADPAATATTNTALYATNMALGSYTATTPPTNGMIISGSVGIGTTSPGAYPLAITVGGTGPQSALLLNASDSGVTTSEVRIDLSEGGTVWQGIAGKYNSASQYLGFSVSAVGNTWNGVGSFWYNGGLSIGTTYYTTVPATNGILVSGDSTLSRSDAGTVTLAVRNTNAGAGAVTTFEIGNDGSASEFSISTTSGAGGGNTTLKTLTNDLILGSNNVSQMYLDGTSIGVFTATPDISALMHFVSTTQGVRFPNMTTTQKNAISSPGDGLLIYDQTLQKLCFYAAGAWHTVTSV